MGLTFTRAAVLIILFSAHTARAGAADILSDFVGYTVIASKTIDSFAGVKDARTEGRGLAVTQVHNVEVRGADACGAAEVVSNPLADGQGRVVSQALKRVRVLVIATTQTLQVLPFKGGIELVLDHHGEQTGLHRQSGAKSGQWATALWRVRIRRQTAEGSGRHHHHTHATVATHRHPLAVRL